MLCDRLPRFQARAQCRVVLRLIDGQRIARPDPRSPPQPYCSPPPFPRAADAYRGLSVIPHCKGYSTGFVSSALHDQPPPPPSAAPFPFSRSPSVSHKYPVILGHRRSSGARSRVRSSMHAIPHTASCRPFVPFLVRPEPKTPFQRLSSERARRSERVQVRRSRRRMVASTGLLRPRCVALSLQFVARYQVVRLRPFQRADRGCIRPRGQVSDGCPSSRRPHSLTLASAPERRPRRPSAFFRRSSTTHPDRRSCSRRASVETFGVSIAARITAAPCSSRACRLAVRRPR